ncbi:MAG: hypothetical protein KAR54_00530 [Candidatus Pacebacteria bacterium]|nr:hypothetical protein [Candidatus Paceibacterota bacterium]
MKKISLITILIIFLIIVLIDQKFKPTNMEDLIKLSVENREVIPPKRFTTDGCSLWPNGFLGVDFTNICINHDMQYWAGGSAEERKNSDIELKNEVNKILYPMGSIMYLGIRPFGHPLIPAPWRWGYGYEYYYKY